MTKINRNWSAQYRIKLALDKVVAVVLLVLLFPILILVSLAILIDDGRPIFFRQLRLGSGARPFRIWKFRSMIDNADDHLSIDGVPQRDRISRVGRGLRYSSIDELPQLLNIISGDMSFVGPRPVLPEHESRYTENQKRRFFFRPGVTGLAQVSGRNLIKWSERIRLDVEYIENYTLWQDFLILLKTTRVWLSRDGVIADRNPGQVDDLGNDNNIEDV